MTVQPLRLGVNIDHIATVRNARGGTHPDPVAGALQAIRAGANGITAHLREDRRHITDDDMERLQALCEQENIPLNMEMAATEEMLEIAARLKPHAVCLVPERREERTTEGGLDVAGLHNSVQPIIRSLIENGSRVSLFIEANETQIRAAAATGAPVVELHTGAYAHAIDDEDDELSADLLRAIQSGAALGSDLGLEIHAGHGITFGNVASLAAIPQVVELNIGHFLIGEAIFQGLDAVLKEMRAQMDRARSEIA